eukprot:GEZU01033465.1.p1 GENE.GEZU01033465.1~~GEZU01033465.1.p1  ORF type:complete len:168 (+),score=53.89 GEZU01033465.1:134-637(+)
MEAAVPPEAFLTDRSQYEHKLAQKEEQAERNDEIVENFLKKLYNGEDVSKYILKDAILESDNTPELKTAHDYVRFVKDLRAAFPDLKVRIVETIGQEDSVAARLILTGTWTQDKHGCKATHKLAHFSQYIFVHLNKQGLITDLAEVWDWNTLHQQTGYPLPEKLITA